MTTADDVKEQAEARISGLFDDDELEGLDSFETAVRIAAALAAAGLLADPDALARAKAEALREAAGAMDRQILGNPFSGASLGPWLRDRADRINPTEPTVGELQAEAQRLCDADRRYETYPEDGAR